MQPKIAGRQLLVMQKGENMNFQEFADGFLPMTSIISVRKMKDGGYGDIRIVTGNRMYLDLIENPQYFNAPTMENNKFIPNSPYERYVAKNLPFEDLCYRAAILKKPLHTYVHMDAADLWFNVFLMPIDYEDGDVCYCTYTTKITEVKELDLLSTESLQTSSDVIRTCIKLHGTDDFEQTMKDIIKDIRIICGAEVCSLMLIDFSTGSYSMLATSVRENSRIKRVTQFTNFYDIAASWIDMIGESECLIIKSKQDMKYIEKINNPWFLTLDEAGVDSVVMFPLRYNREVLGYIWATNFATENAMRIKETLELTTFFVSSEVATYKMMKRLEHISYTDLLTGVKNRNAMNNRITAITNGEELLTEPYGVVFVDLNGLKQVNDEQGHQAGDLLLKKAALILQEIFVDEDIYRAGGDEFLIITAGCNQQQFDKKIELLRKKASDPDNVSFSIGVCYGDHGCDVRDAMGVADGKMYDDKQQFYVLHPERKHR